MAMVESAANSTRPAMILDIDGVLLVNRDLDGNPGGYVKHPERKWSAYNPAHGEWLRRVHQDTADIYYISDLIAYSYSVIGQHLELPEFDWVNTYAYKEEPRSATRRRLAITALFGERPLVWLDDLIDEPERLWARRRNQGGAPTLLVKTNPDLGLQPGHPRRVDAWLEQFTPTP